MYKSEEIKTRSIKNTNTIIEALKKMDIEKCKLYARKSDSLIDKWIVIRKMRFKKVRQRLTFL